MYFLHVIFGCEMINLLHSVLVKPRKKEERFCKGKQFLFFNEMTCEELEHIPVSKYTTDMVHLEKLDQKLKFALNKIKKIITDNTCLVSIHANKDACNCTVDRVKGLHMHVIFKKDKKDENIEARLQEGVKALSSIGGYVLKLEENFEIVEHMALLKFSDNVIFKGSNSTQLLYYYRNCNIGDVFYDSEQRVSLTSTKSIEFDIHSKDIEICGELPFTKKRKLGKKSDEIEDEDDEEGYSKTRKFNYYTEDTVVLSD